MPTPIVTLEWLDRQGLAWAQTKVTRYHYLHHPVSSRAALGGYAVHIEGIGRVGLLLVGRPQAPQHGTWYGDVAAWLAKSVACTRWQVINVNRIWFSSAVQRGGRYYSARYLPGYVNLRPDWTGEWHSTLASVALGELIRRVRLDYLLARPPVYPEDPYQLRWLMSYCDTRQHTGALYRASGFTLFSTNAAGIQTWRRKMPALRRPEQAAVLARSLQNRRSIYYRALRQSAATVRQPALFTEVLA